MRLFIFVGRFSAHTSIIALALITIAIGCFGVAAQTIQILDSASPSVFLRYSGAVNREERCKGEGSKQRLLELRNNTNSYINVNANFNNDLASKILDVTEGQPTEFRDKILTSGSEVELCYDVEGMYQQKGSNIPKRTNPPKSSVPFCRCSYVANTKFVNSPSNTGFWIKPGSSVRFLVPSTFLKENLKVYTEFSYPWEFTRGHLKINEPRHRVYFYYYDIPTNGKKEGRSRNSAFLPKGRSH